MAGTRKREVPGHYLRANHASWTPPCLISFDTETVSKMDGDDEVMSLRLWGARITDRRAPKSGTMTDDRESGEFADDLAVTVHTWMRRRRTAWMYAHNLGFDLTTSDLVRNMLDLGWRVTDFAVGALSPFVRLKQGEHNLTVVDSFSWLPVALAQIADMLGMVKPDLPEQDDSRQAWQARCDADVDILHTAMLTLMDWWENEGLGNWNITGSASGFNAMRHIPSGEQILIRPDESECDQDRRAVYGGRRSVWETGTHKTGHYTELDIVKAYTTACRDLPLPTGRWARVDSVPLDHKWLDCDRWGLIAECQIRTDRPTVPVRHGSGVWYPVGEFRTTLAGPDIRECAKLGMLKQVGGGWLHRLGYALQPWADWCIASMYETEGTIPELAKLVHKVWARSVVGKWAQRGHEVMHLGPSPNGGWDYEEAWHHGRNVPAGIVDFAGERYQVAAVSQSDNAYPAILAFVESYVRVAINRAIDIVGDAHMFQCDTDGYICDLADGDTIDAINAAIAPFTVRPKRHFTRIHITGPQHMELDKERRTAGIPASASYAGPGLLKAQIWPKLGWQLANGRPGAYVRPTQTYRMAATYAPGWVLSDGRVVAVEMALDTFGGNQVVPWPQTRYAVSGAVLGPHQNRNLVRYIDG